MLTATITADHHTGKTTPPDTALGRPYHHLVSCTMPWRQRRPERRKVKLRAREHGKLRCSLGAWAVWGVFLTLTLLGGNLYTSWRWMTPSAVYNQETSKLSLTADHQPTHRACERYQGFFHIRQTDELGGVGTALLQLVMNQIEYAETHHLLPWVHLDNFSKVFWDEAVHAKGPGVFLPITQQAHATYRSRTHGVWRDKVPGPPQLIPPSSPQTLHFPGTGVWQHYFEPIVPDFVPGDESCRTKPYVTMDLTLVNPGLHGFDTQLATRAWRYEYLPDYIQRQHWSYHEWIEPQRLRAHRVWQQYMRPLPYLRQAAQRANPQCGDEPDTGTWCLGLHIRHSDKAAGRKILALDDFLPFVQAFFTAGGDFVYIATDSAMVWQTIQTSWPHRDRIRAASNIIRSSNTTAVFDLAHSHHKTNQQVLIEILALSRCQFLVHGFSAVSEASIWINLAQHNRSVNLEDPHHINATMFERVVALSRADTPDALLPQPPRTMAWWNQIKATPLSAVADASEYIDENHSLCSQVGGTLLISEVSTETSGYVDSVIFESVLNLLLLAKRMNLKPVIRLNKAGLQWIYDENVHASVNQTMRAFQGSLDKDGCPIFVTQNDSADIRIEASNVWNTYVSAPDRGSQIICPEKPIYWLNASNVATFTEKCPWALRPGVAPPSSRLEAQALVTRHVQLHPLLHQKAAQVNSFNASNHEGNCMGVLFRLTVKQKGKAYTADNYLPYLEEFVRSSPGPIYVASDTNRPLRYMEKNFPPDIVQRILSQGQWVARSATATTPLYMMDSPHRINSEILVDLLALSKCRVLLHSTNSMADAILYQNPNIISINMNDPEAPFPSDLPGILSDIRSVPLTPFKSTKDANFAVIDISGAHVVSNKNAGPFATNAIVYLAQKKHSSYGRDSFETLLRSLELLRENYLKRHCNNVDVFIFHVNSFNASDMAAIEAVLSPECAGSVRLVDLDQSAFWGRPHFLKDSDPNTWYAYPLFSEGYRNMIQFFAIHIWEFFTRLNRKIHANKADTAGYKYILRLDEDSFLHSHIAYDLFDWMESSGYVYGYRMCSYEMQPAKRMWTRYQQSRRQFVPQREIDLQGCGFYNNFFVAQLAFFRRADVQDFLKFIHDRGHIYTWRLGDLMIHTMSIYGFAKAAEVHRFLDWTYEHGTVDRVTGCLVWGGMQAGYNDINATKRLSQYYREQSRGGDCDLNLTKLTVNDLSPTYAHLPTERNTVELDTVVAGQVEVVGKGLLSG